MHCSVTDSHEQAFSSTGALTLVKCPAWIRPAAAQHGQPEQVAGRCNENENEKIYGN